MKALQSHYSGGGNTTRRIADAKRAQDSLDEKSRPFSSFLDSLQRMPNTFKKEGEEITEPAECSQRFAHQSSDGQSNLH
jgi:hypothetical protein